MDEMATEEYYFQQLMTPVSNITNSDHNLETFFNVKLNVLASEDKTFDESLFLDEIRLFSLLEPNDTITLSSSLMENEDNFKFYLNSFSDEKALTSFCR